MKKSLFLFLFCMLLITLSGCFAGGGNERYLRIHIRADSNQTDSQSVKYAIKEKLVAYLTPMLAECGSKAEALESVNACLGDITAICDKTLKEQGFSYTSRAALKNEFFPLRSYGSFTFDEGRYDSLIIELGEGKGDNWWCMVYPPLCFTGGETDGSTEITYKSKILEIIEEFRQKYLS